MSRIGKLPVIVPEKVKASIEGQTVKVEGPKGKVEKTFDHSVKLSLEESSILVTPVGGATLARAMQGTARSIINGMVFGALNGYSKDLEIQGVGFRATVNGKALDLNLGYSHPIKYPIPDSINITVAENTKIKVEGVDKQLVGQVAADIKHFYPVEPYKGKGVRIVGEFVRRKEGKKTA
ncbi:MAG TPA: 50S ribosomal protein L6 [Opitutae bacterium]|nr:50S ribosomal protein L6 [Opitutae bacterium]|tara:strand:+ start:3389 stop:3925 length:537 start_codon:yes stop_codon:yes gene_type:complete